jgi:hypothetical protein
MATLVEIATQDGGAAIAFICRIYNTPAPGFDKVYVGSTKRELNIRMSDQKGAKREYDKGKGSTYCTSYDVLSYEGAKVELLEEDAYLDMQHMRDREAFWIQRLGCVNKTTPRPQQPGIHSDIPRAEKGMPEVRPPSANRRHDDTSHKQEARSNAK